MKQTCVQLVEGFNAQTLEAQYLHFQGVEGYDVYNITAPIEFAGERVIAGRVELRTSEHSTIRFFEETAANRWQLRTDLPNFELQDPFFTIINNELILGGVEISEHPQNPEQLIWRTVLRRGKSFAELTPFFYGPTGMKDLRIAELADGSILVLTRPQGEKGGRGKIGMTIVPTLAELTVAGVEAAPLFEQFIDEEWGGANAIYPLANGMVGVLGHIANFDSEGNRHYYSMSFTIDPVTATASPMKLIAMRQQFLPGEAKRPDLEDVIFSGGLAFTDTDVRLYVGVGDSYAQYAVIPNPFLEV